MEILIPLLIIVAVVAVAVWIIKLIPFPAGLEIVKAVLIAIVCIIGLVKVLAFL